MLFRSRSRTATVPRLTCAARRPSSCAQARACWSRHPAKRSFGRVRGVIRSFAHGDYPAELLRECKAATVSVVLPAREVAGTIEPIVERILGLEELVDQLLVVDAASEDGSAEIAARAGAEVVQEADLEPDLGPVLGKGDAMWRSLAALRGNLVVYVDADTTGFTAHLVTG